MIYFEDLPLDEGILKALGELSINYVFQPIFCGMGKQSMLGRRLCDRLK